MNSLRVAHAFKTLYAYLRLRSRVSRKELLAACDHLVATDL